MLQFLRKILIVENKIISWLLPIFWMGVIFYLSGISSLELTGNLAPYDYIARSFAHVAEYAILAFLWRRNVGKLATYGIAGSYAILDELHQSFVFTRSGQVSDTMLDGVGIWFGLVLYTYFMTNSSLSRNEKIIETNSADETKSFAKDVLRKLKPGSVLALVGDLGSGKTTFVQGIAEGLSMDQHITSPTFILRRDYEVKPIINNQSPIAYLYHFDLYRLENTEEVLNIGFEEAVGDASGLTVVEWAEKIEKLMPEHTLWIYFDHVSENTRKIRLEEQNAL